MRKLKPESFKLLFTIMKLVSGEDNSDVCYFWDRSFKKRVRVPHVPFSYRLESLIPWDFGKHMVPKAELLSAKVFKCLCGTAPPSDWEPTWTLDLAVFNS